MVDEPLFSAAIGLIVYYAGPLVTAWSFHYMLWYMQSGCVVLLCSIVVAVASSDEPQLKRFFMNIL